MCFGFLGDPCKAAKQENADLQVKAQNDATTITNLKAQAKAANDIVLACQSDGDAKTKTIAQQAQSIQGLNSQVQDLTAKLAATPGSIFAVGCPNLLQTKDPAKVILGQFIIKTATATLYINYPVHSAIFQPCPWFERILNSADCNRARTDLTEIQIAGLISNVFQKGEQYKTDQSQWNILDYWTLACIVYAIGGDDCESEASAIASAILYYQMKWGVFKTYYVTLGLGHLVVGTQQLGHGFVCLWHYSSTDINDSYIIEATLQYAATPKTMKEAKNDYMVDWDVIGYARTEYAEGSYQVRDSMKWWGTAHVVGDYKREYSFLNKVKRAITREPDPKKIKHDHIQKIWQDKKTTEARL